MAILGFIVAFIFSLAILLGGPIVFLAINAFYGDRPWPALILSLSAVSSCTSRLPIRLSTSPSRNGISNV